MSELETKSSGRCPRSREATAALIQRARVLEAMVLVVAERGFAATTVDLICARAKVSRDTFLKFFDGPEGCFLAVMDNAYQRIRTLITRAFAGEESWVTGIRHALAGVLMFFDAEPVLASVLLVEVVAAGSWARDRREQHLATLTSLIEDRWGAPETGHPHPLVPTGVMAALQGLLHSHVVTKSPDPAIALLGPLMAIVAAPYLDQPALLCEIERSEATVQYLLACGEREPSPARLGPLEIPNLLLDPRAHRARAALLHLAANPGASNRQLARAVGIARDTHISTLLARLHAAGLVIKETSRIGGPNASRLTPYGVRVVSAIQLACGERTETSGTAQATR
jgi:AcrR family transcriptional regulator